MPAADRKLVSEFMQRGHALLDGKSIPPEFTVPGREEVASWLLPLLQQRQWFDLADPGFFDRELLSKGERYADVDLGDVAYSLSLPAFLYYAPGLSIHFLQKGDYSNNARGPEFFFNFVRRLHEVTPGMDRIMRNYLCSIAQKHYDLHGDPYEDFGGLGYEYEDLATRSLAGFILKHCAY